MGGGHQMGMGSFGVNLRLTIVTNGDFVAQLCESDALYRNYFGRTCYQIIITSLDCQLCKQCKMQAIPMSQCNAVSHCVGHIGEPCKNMLFGRQNHETCLTTSGTYVP